MTARAWLALLVLQAGCDTTAPANTAPADPAIGTMQVAVDSDVREVPFSQAQCSEEGDHQLVELFFVRNTSDGYKGQRPRILIARIRGTEVLEAEAFVPQTRFGDTEYEMLVLVAKPLNGTTAACRVEGGADGSTLVCNDTTVVPWLGAGERPRPSFKVTFRCPT